MIHIFEGSLNVQQKKFGIVVSRFNDFITSRLLEGAQACLLRHGVEPHNITVASVPGAFEIPLIAQTMASSQQYDAIICLGAVIRGSTPHFDYVAGEAAKGIAQASIRTGIPVTFGVLTTENAEQAIERVGIKMGNKGWEAAMAAIEMCTLMEQLGNHTIAPAHTMHERSIEKTV